MELKVVKKKLYRYTTKHKEKKYNNYEHYRQQIVITVSLFVLRVEVSLAS